MSIKIYKDSAANAIFIEDANGVQFLNSLQATEGSGVCSIHDLAKGFDIVSDAPFSDYTDENGVAYGNDVTSTVNALNALFSASGTNTGELPSITSSLTVNLTEGDTLNYELTADYGVGYEWSNLPSGVVTVEGNIRKIIGGSNLTAGTYAVTMKAINYNGEDTKTLTINVSTPPFSNTKSINFNNSDYLGANASLVESTLGRNSNGSGSNDAWTIAFWYKASSDNTGQTIVYFGNQDVTNNGFIELRQTNATGGKRLRLRYGSNNNYVQLSTAAGSLTPNTWQHIVVTYNGGTTGASSGDINNYYGRFSIYIDNSLQTTSNTHSNYGYSGSIVGQNWRVGRFASGSHLRGARLDELALWSSDQASNVSDIYNGGAPFDLGTLTDSPVHWWRMGDGDTYPFLQDNGSAANCIFQMYNMTAADIVSDTP